MTPSQRQSQKVWVQSIGTAALLLWLLALGLPLGLNAQTGPPTAVTGDASEITTNSATIGGAVYPNFLTTAYYFQWGTDMTYGNTFPLATVPDPYNGAVVSATLTSLAPGTTYHYQLVASNTLGTSYGADRAFTTIGPPIVVTGPASNITGTSAYLTGTVNPNGASANYIFLWGTTTAYGNSTEFPMPPFNYAQDVGAPVSGLSPATTYHYQLTATNSAGLGLGVDQTFTTLSAVSVDGHLLSYITNNGTITIVSYSGPGGALTIPGTITGLPVTVLDTGAFYGTPLTDVSIPENVTTIGSHAFYFCSLTNVALPNSLTYIGPNAFLYCEQLPAITIPDNVTNIGSAAFQFCLSLSNLTLGKNLRCIESQAFFDCALTQVTIPDSVTNLADGPLGWGGPEGAFCYCDGLTNVIIGKGLAYLGIGTFTACYNLLSVYLQGNAPPFGSSFFGSPTTPFFKATNAIVYYLPGTTGWTSTYAGQPALLWNPIAQTSDGSFGVRQNRFGFNIAGTADIPLVIEASTGLAPNSWVPLQNCTLTNGLVYFTDAQWMSYSQRFYRIRSP